MLETETEKRELTQDQKLALEHAQKVAKLSLDKAREMQAELHGLGFVPDALSVKIVDLMPSHIDDVRVLFAKERMVLEKKYIEQILSTVEKYR